MYTTVDGNKVPIEYYVTEENFDKAEHLLDLVRAIMPASWKNILVNIPG